MTKQYIDRTNHLEGLQRAFTDFKIPTKYLRDIENLSIPDGKLQRRPGYKKYTSFGRQALSKTTKTLISKKANDSEHLDSKAYRSPLSYGLLRHHNDFQLYTYESKTIGLNLVLGELEPLVTSPYNRKPIFSRQHSITSHTVGNPHIINCVHNIPHTGLSVYQVEISGVTGTLSENVNGTRLAQIINGNLTLIGVNTVGGALSGGIVAVKYINTNVRDNGVYVLDMSVLGNVLKYNKNTPDSPGDTIVLLDTDVDFFESLPLTTIAVGYSKEHIFVTLDLIGSPESARAYEYFLNAVTFKYPIEEYKPGDDYKLVISYDSSSRALQFFVNSTLVASSNIPIGFSFVGQYDNVNNSALRVERDVVILNESTVRASYASTCRVSRYRHGNQTHFSEDVLDIHQPWCLTPPINTSIYDLFIYRGAIPDIVLIDPNDINLLGKWKLDDGVGVCKDSSIYERNITLHHANPSYVKDTNLLHGLGLSIADGQHVILSYNKGDNKYIQDSFSMLKNTFGHSIDGEDLSGAGSKYLNYQSRHDYTIMMQIKTPYNFQKELNIIGSSPNLVSLDGTETRQSLNVIPYTLVDGKKLYTDRAIKDHNGVENQYPRAYDMTLFSLEGTKEPEVGNNNSDRYRIPIARVLINPEGYLVFEAYKAQGDYSVDLSSRLYRLVSEEKLLPSTVYNICVVQRAEKQQSIDYNSFSLEIYIQHKNIDSNIRLVTWYTELREDSSFHKCRTTSVEHCENYDVIIGCSQVNDGWDRSISAPIDLTVASYKGPWKIPQHFMGPYQDQPGFFTLGYFRLWATSLSVEDINTYADKSISSGDYPATLLYNLELANITGTQIKNDARYPLLFNLGYKSWGVPQGYKNEVVSFASVKHMKKELFPNAWEYADSLGYRILSHGPYSEHAKKIEGLVATKSTLNQTFGLLAVVGDSLIINESLDSDKINSVGVMHHGLLNDFITGQKWSGTSIGERTVLTSYGGIPKVYNGKNLLVAGFKSWDGGTISIEAGGGSMANQKWYSFRVVYFSEEYSIEHFSYGFSVYLPAGFGGFNIYHIPSHPDPRITSIRIYRTSAQDIEEFAASGPLFLTSVGSLPNIYHNIVSIEDDDTTLYNSPLNLKQTSLPSCAYSASSNGILYLAGSPLEPDAVYFSDPGNPERFDTIENKLILEESGGDVITGIVEAFGSLYVFKTNSTWRIDYLGDNQHSVIRIKDIGASSPSSIVNITMPDSGRTVIAIWSRHGPYLIDGQSFQYIGNQLEKIEEQFTSNGFTWLESSDVVAINDIKRRELLFIYRPIVNSSFGPTKRHCEILAFNYRFGSWTKHTNILGCCGLATTFTAYKVGADNPGINYKVLLGADNGTIYLWGESKIDGEDNNILVEGKYTLVYWDPSNSTLYTNVEGINVFPYMWVTVVTDNGYRSYPVTMHGFVNQRLEIDTGFFGDSSIFVPEINNHIYTHIAPAFIEYVWDELNYPFIDKKIIDLLIWLKGKFMFRYAKNYIDAYNEWIEIADQDSKRFKCSLNALLESIKMQLVSYDVDCGIRGYGFYCSYMGEGQEVR